MASDDASAVRAREIATQTARKLRCWRAHDSRDIEALTDAILDALTTHGEAIRAAAVRETVERACKIACVYCHHGWPLDDTGTHVHATTTATTWLNGREACRALGIRALLPDAPATTRGETAHDPYDDMMVRAHRHLKDRP